MIHTPYVHIGMYTSVAILIAVIYCFKHASIKFGGGIQFYYSDKATIMQCCIVQLGYLKLAQDFGSFVTVQ